MRKFDLARSSALCRARSRAGSAAHSEVDATFFHTFNPQQHSMIRCAGYPDLNSDTGGYYLPMS
jgi:hypothetical protein